MAPVRLEFSDHAKQRLRERKITREMIRKCLSSGTTISFDINGRSVKAARIGGRILEIVFIHVTGGFLLVTAYWKD